MKRFAFALEPVLDHRKRIERERSSEHARALSAQRAAEAARDGLFTRRDDARATLVHGHARLDAQTLHATYAHLEYLDRAIVAAEQRVAALAAETMRAHARLIDSARDRQVLSTLKERRREAHALDAALAEQRELDDQNARLFERAHAREGPMP